MPFRDAEAKREYFRQYMADRRAAGTATWETTEKKREAKRRERSRKRQVQVMQTAAKLTNRKDDTDGK